MRIKMFEEYGTDAQYYEMWWSEYKEEYAKFDFVNLTGWEWDRLKSMNLKVVPRSGCVLSIPSKKVRDEWTHIFEIVKKDDGWFFCIEDFKKRVFNRYESEYAYYKCDQIDGLIELLKDKGVVKFPNRRNF